MLHRVVGRALLLPGHQAPSHQIIFIPVVIFSFSFFFFLCLQKPYHAKHDFLNSALFKISIWRVSC